MVFKPVSLAIRGEALEAYVRFQDITWQLVPENSEWANTMGFNVMCRHEWERVDEAVRVKNSSVAF